MQPRLTEGGLEEDLRVRGRRAEGLESWRFAVIDLSGCCPRLDFPVVFFII